MEQRTTILSELREISQELAAIAFENPYQVPLGYFEALPGEVMFRIETEDTLWVDPTLTINKENVYTIPQEYFDGLASQIMMKITQEEQTVPDSLHSISIENVYKAPEGYFDGLSGSILNRIKAMETQDAKEELEFLSPLLGQIEKKNPFTSPVSYFDEFSDNIVAGVKAVEFVNEELENLSPLMLSLKHKNVYETPAGYFENLATTILTKVKQPPARIINIDLGKKIFRYAAAAIVIGFIATGSYFYFKPADIVNGANPDLAKVTTEEIENFVNNNTLVLPDTTSVLSEDNNDEEDGKDLLADVSDEELQQYLEQHGGTVNPIVN